MSKHPDFSQEQSKLNEVITYITSEVERLTVLESEQNEEVQQLLEESGGNYTMDLDISNRIHGMTRRMLNGMHHAVQHPYFTRIDFQKENHNLEQFYMGKWGVLDPLTQRPIVVDWRSAIANLYYTHQVGPAHYQTPHGEVRGEITLKRLYEIDQGELIDIIEADIIGEDSYLNNVLSDHADSRLKDIVTTIQAEQNQVLRCNPKAPLVVQGVAGAGKTTIALHRIMWLLYTYQQTMQPQNLMIIAPNPIFLDYISAVLPDMGVEDVIQETFHGLATRLCATKLYPLKDSDTLLSLLDTNLDPDKKDQLVQSATLKGSMQFKRVVEQYIAGLPDQILPTEGIQVADMEVIKREKIYQIFAVQLAPFPIKPRIRELRKMLNNQLKKVQEKYRVKVEQTVLGKANFIRERLKNSPNKRMAMMKELYAKRDQLLNTFDEESKDVVKKYIQQIQVPKLMQAYCALLQEETPDILIEHYYNTWPVMCQNTLDRLNRRQMETADIPPIIMLQKALFGHAERLDIHHTVLDEAQDFSPFMFDILKSFTHNKAFTIVGDLSQGIYVYRGVKDWLEMKESVFEDAATYHELITSYRNTVEIMRLAEFCAMRHASHRTPAQPVLRHGMKPRLIQTVQPVDDIADEINALRDKGMKTIAIIDKMPKDCNSLYKKLKKKVPELQLLKEGDQQYQGGMMVMPAYMCKGLEFDAVILRSVDVNVYQDDLLHARLLYVCLTRPLHHLSLYYDTEVTPLIDQQLCDMQF